MQSCLGGNEENTEVAACIQYFTEECAEQPHAKDFFRSILSSVVLLVLLLLVGTLLLDVRSHCIT